MPSNRAFFDSNIVQPTKYIVSPAHVAKELPLEPWQLPKFEPFVRVSYSSSRLQDPNDLIGWSLSIRIGPKSTLQGIGSNVHGCKTDGAKIDFSFLFGISGQP